MNMDCHLSIATWERCPIYKASAPINPERAIRILCYGCRTRVLEMPQVFGSHRSSIQRQPQTLGE